MVPYLHGPFTRMREVSEQGGNVETHRNPEFLRGRAVHLRNKRAEVARCLRTDGNMPAAHRTYKVRDLLPAIDRAIERIPRGTYGVCMACGEPIPVRRLELRPEVECCVPCAGGAPS